MAPTRRWSRRSTVSLLVLAVLLCLAFSVAFVSAENEASTAADEYVPDVVAEAVVVDTSVADSSVTPEEVAKMTGAMPVDEVDEAAARKIMEEDEANAVRIAAEALASSSIKEARVYEGVGRIHATAKIHPGGCAAATRDYLGAVVTRIGKANEAVRRARADVNEARAHASASFPDVNKALAQAEAQAEAAVQDVMREYGGDVPKTCIAEVGSEIDAQFTRANNMQNRFLATWTRHFSIFQGSVMLLIKTGEGVLQHLVELWYPTCEVAWDFVYSYAEKAQAQFSTARRLADDGEQPDLVTYLTFCAHGFGFALVPILTMAVGVWLVCIFWPLLVVGVFAPPFFFQVWWRVFILWNTYGLSYPRGYFSALSEYRVMLNAGNYGDALERAADAFFDIVGEDASDSFYNGIVVMFALWGVAVFTATIVYIWLRCFMRCAGAGRRRRAAPSYPRRSKAPKSSSQRAESEKQKTATKASPKPSPKPAASAAASRKKKN